MHDGRKADPNRARVPLALRETYYYCLFGGPATAALLFFVLILATPDASLGLKRVPPNGRGGSLVSV